MNTCYAQGHCQGLWESLPQGDWQAIEEAGHRNHSDLIIISSGRVISLNGVPLVRPHQNIMISLFMFRALFCVIRHSFVLLYLFCHCCISSSWHCACRMVGAQSVFLEWMSEWTDDKTNWRKPQMLVECTKHRQLEIKLVEQGGVTLLTRIDSKLQVGVGPCGHHGNNKGIRWGWWSHAIKKYIFLKYIHSFSYLAKLIQLCKV